MNMNQMLEQKKKMEQLNTKKVKRAPVKQVTKPKRAKFTYKYIRSTLYFDKQVHRKIEGLYNDGTINKKIDFLNAAVRYYL